MASTGAAKSVLLFGATGFVGGHILHHLLTQPLKAGGKGNSDRVRECRLEIIAVSGSPSKCAQIETWYAFLQASSVVRQGVSLSTRCVDRDGDGTDFCALATQLSAEVDLVIQAATSDNLKLTQAIHQGLRDGRKGSGKQGGLIHFSGVQLIESEPLGEYLDVKEYDDLDLKALNEVPASAAHREIDLE